MSENDTPTSDQPEAIIDQQDVSGGEQSPRPNEDEVTQDLGNVATNNTTNIPVMSYDDGKKFDTEREANQTGWEDTAQALNDKRGLGDKIFGKNETTADDVMQDEALRVNSIINQSLKSNQETARHLEARSRNSGEPIDEELPPTTRQGVFKELRAKEPERIGRSWREEPLFSPKGEHVERSAEEIAEREKRAKQISDKVNEALAQGDIKEAERELALLDEDRWIRSLRFDRITMQEHLTPALRRTLHGIFRNGDAESLVQLVDSKYLSDYIYPNMAVDAGIHPEELRADKDMKRKIISLAHKAIEKYGPHLREMNRSGNLPVLDELTRRIELLSRLGVATKEEIANNQEVRYQAQKVAIDTTAGNIARGYPLRLSQEAWYMVRLGLLDINRLADDPAMIRIATMDAAAGSEELVEQAKKNLRRELLGEEEPEEDSQQAA